MTLLYKAKSIIERDALRARLHGAAIASDSPERTVSRKITNQTVDLSLGGYSVLFEGFPVLVPEADLERAQEVLAAFLAEMRTSEARQVAHWNRAYFCSVFSLMIPVLFTLLAVFHALRAVQAREAWPRSRAAAAAALVCWCAGAGLTGSLVAHLLS